MEVVNRLSKKPLSRSCSCGSVSKPFSPLPIYSCSKCNSFQSCDHNFNDRILTKKFISSPLKSCEVSSFK